MNVAAHFSPPSLRQAKLARSGEVAILLGLHNGQAFLGDQLDSLETQTYANWFLLVSDDGSTDQSRSIIQDFAGQHPRRRVELFRGPCIGWAANFLSLLQAVGPDIPFAAFCDQDDVWMPNKLDRALDRLAGVHAAVPALYCGRTFVTDAAFAEGRPSPAFRQPPCFENALVQSIAGGNTMVLNRAAIDVLQAAAPYATGIISHDWWAYQVITGVGGRVIYDQRPTVHYRQHGGNLVGANDTLAASFGRLIKGLRGRYRTWNTANLNALFAIEDRFEPKAKRVLNEFAEARRSGLSSRLSRLKRSGVHRQTRRGNFSLWLAALLGKI